MPLTKGSSAKTISNNIRELHTGKTFAHTEEKFGKKRADKQAVAIALETARKVKRAIGGNLTGFPGMGAPSGVATGPVHTGPIVSAVPGRTDRHNMDVPSGSYVLPADTVSHLGQNNTLAGMATAHKMFGPGGAMHLKQPGIPKLPTPKKTVATGMAKSMFARGGDAGGARGSGHHVGESVPIIAAGGEIVIPPHIVAKVGGGDLNEGHRILDKWVMMVRKEHRKTLANLPPPAKS